MHLDTTGCLERMNERMLYERVAESISTTCTVVRYTVKTIKDMESLFPVKPQFDMKISRSK